MAPEIGDKIETHPNTWVEIKTVGENTARVFQLDHNKEKIKLFRKEGYLEGVLTFKEPKRLDL